MTELRPTELRPTELYPAERRPTEVRPRVLCVDDEPLVLAGLARALRPYCDVQTAVGGRAGLAALAADPGITVVISDLRMPELDGATFLACVRRLAPDVTRIILTGQADLAGAITAVNEGQVFRFLLKPIAPPLLRAAVDAAATQHRLLTAERKGLEAKLLFQATHDALTGLGNRDQFRARTAGALAVPGAADAGRVAVLSLDLDDFNVANDSLGHTAGDDLLRAVAERLRDATAGCGVGAELVARIDRDEFAVLLDDVAHEPDARQVAERITTALAAPFRVAGREVQVTVSVGIARATGGISADELLRNANLAMRHAKTEDRGGVAAFAPAIHAVMLDRAALTTDLRQAVARLDADPVGETREEFAVVYQPIIAFATGRAVGAEALLRWRHPERGTVSPLTFIPIAEESGLIVALGRWVLGEACRQAARWAASNAGPPLETPGPWVSVNVSARQLQHPTFVDDVADALHRAALDPSRLMVEITESVLVRDTEATIARLHALKVLGVAVAIDDFGTGYSSLAYLRRFPLDVLKIDKTFVDRIAQGAADAALARAIVELGAALGLRCVAEGVEDDEQRRSLAGLGCVWGQGYLFDRPRTAADVAIRFATDCDRTDSPDP